MRRSLTLLFAMFFAILASEASAALSISYRYRSPRNPERKFRPATQLIVLHTTEAPARSSLNKLCDRGECHYCVTEDGSIYAIVDRNREAFHAGRSMWNGVEDVDRISIGIECVGYHNRPMSMIQLAAIRALVADLKAVYRITDDRVVCHSHVAYGMPNRWQKHKHRGRKRCGMLFAMPSVRSRLGLRLRPGGDIDVARGRLRVGDEYLRTVLYGRTDTMVSYYGRGKSMSMASSSKSNIFSGLRTTMTSSKTKTKSKVQTRTKSKVQAKPKVQAKVQTKAKPKVQTKTKPRVQTKAKPKVQARVKVQAKAKPKIQTKTKAKVTAKPKAKVQTKAKTTTKPKTAVSTYTTTTKPKSNTVSR